MKKKKKKIEEFKKELHCEPVKRTMLGIDEFLPKTPHARLNFNHEYDIATDLAIAKCLGLEIDDFEEFYKDNSREEAEAWAATLPDMPKLQRNYYHF
jgi:hypothetical protein